jgi:Mrp family chromosome partitioning ATPase
MSIGFLLDSADNAIIWRGPKKNGMIRQFLSEVDWGQLDCLILDTPPGTSDEHLSVTSYLGATDGKWAAVLVTTPQEVSLLDVRKEISFCKKMNIPIAGVVENMAQFVCPKCSVATSIFPSKARSVSEMCEQMEVPYLGSLPLDPKVAKCADEGKDYLAEQPKSPTALAVAGVVEKIGNFFTNMK